MFSLRRLFGAALVCLLGVVMLGAGGDSSATRFNRIGHNMVCVCSCGQILLDCNHVGCPDSGRMIGELHDQMDGPNGTGADSLIFNWFVAKYGATVLAAPIRGGFDTVAWIVPLAIFVFAIAGTAFLVRAWVQRRGMQLAGAPAPLQPSNAVLDRIRRETQY